MTNRFTAHSLLFAISSLFTSSVFSAAPDFSICEGITGVAKGLCRAGIAVGCDQQTSQACQNIEDQYMAQTGNPPPWAEVTERIVFLTSQTYSPGTPYDSVTSPNTFASLDNADAICQDLADSAGLNGSYQAWLSDSILSPNLRFTGQNDDSPWVLNDGFKTTVVNGFTDLTDGGDIQNPIIVDEWGFLYNMTTEFVWTATNDTGGFLTNHCTSWTSSEGTGVVGYASFGTIDFNWTNGESFACGTRGGARFYCFQQ